MKPIGKYHYTYYYGGGCSGGEAGEGFAEYYDQRSLPITVLDKARREGRDLSGCIQIFVQSPKGKEWIIIPYSELRNLDNSLITP